MQKHLIAAATALLTLSSVQAAPMYYAFEWKGFNYSYTTPIDPEPVTRWEPEAVISGYFKADDVNSDGIITLGEVERFNAGEGEMIGCPGRDSDISGLTGCVIEHFSYETGGPLSFRARAEWSSAGSVYRVYYWDMPEHGRSNFSNDVCCGDSWLSVTQDTKFTMIASVPEPSTWTMLAAGLVVATGAARRRSRACGRSCPTV
ncbi:PEP-CTERM sorting domain-containing protein [[Empedobacter] haloabium]|uniref:PEP-CTERM sorting domain-containing protein n=1 Tax=[Empedobacter] haloabium TaxID=592317 RepID=A0ABZ1UT33_9BURK